MPRKPRDYAAEYAKRIAKGTAAGKPLTESRGHKTQGHEKAQREEAKYRKKQGISSPRLLGQAKLNLWSGRTVPPGMDAQEWDDILYANIENRGGKDEDRQALGEKLKRKYEITQDFQRLVKGGMSYDEAAEESGGTDFYNDRDEFDPIEMYWYHES
jgi:hypothetical protein